MQPCHANVSRRTFNALALAAMPMVGSQANRVEDRRAQFAQDVARSYDGQSIALDLDDVDRVFREIRSPVLGVGVAAGEERAVLACEAAMREACGLGGHTLAIVAFPPRDWRLSECTRVFRTVLSGLDARATVIFGVCHDERLAPGSARVSLLTGRG